MQVDLLNVRSDEEATSNLFLGSPTIRVNGVDIDLNAQGRTDFGRKCRIYMVENEVLGSPSKEMILRAIRGANQVVISVKLIVARWCPICPSVKQLWRELMDQFKFEYEKVDISSPEGKELVTEHLVLSAPTIIIGGKVAFSGKVERSKAVEILKYQCP